MFGDMMSQMGDMQEKMRAELAKIQVDADAGDGAVRVRADGNRQITNISLDREKLDWDDPESIEDLVMVAVNRALELAAEKEAAESQRLLQDMLPGLGGLGGMFGGM